MSRLTHKGLIQRAHKGLYWKGRTSRFGSARPDPVAVAFEVTGERGVGYSGVSASHALGLSTQVPPWAELAVVGRPPSGVEGVVFHSRSNLHRAQLRPMEVSLLEVLRAWPYGVEVSENEFATRIQTLAREKAIDLGRVAKAAVHEPRTVHERLRTLLARRETAPAAIPTRQPSRPGRP